MINIAHVVFGPRDALIKQRCLILAIEPLMMDVNQYELSS
jgi:hypothetical protein